MKRGWCPGLYQPMPAQDGLLIRLRPPGGRLTTQHLHVLADACTAYGNGQIDLTGQARLQVRGLSASSLPSFVAAMVAAGLADADPARESRRRVTCLPNGDAALAESVEAALLASDMPLAEKFDVLIGHDDAPDADIMLHQGALWVAGADVAAHTETQAAHVVALAAWLAGRRMQPLTATFGAAAIYREAGLVADARIPPAMSSQPAIGVLFGRLTVPSLMALATLGIWYGNGVWQTTRQRALALGGVTDAIGFAAAAAACGFITAPNDASRRAFACPGRGECAAGVTDTRRDVLALLPHLPDGMTLHVSGCAKGCARPAPADFTFVGTASGYDLVRRGRTNDPSVAQHLSLAAAGALMRAS